MAFVIVLGLVLAAVIAMNMKKKKNVFIPSLSNKHVVVTGGSSGIGLAIAKKALLEGAFVTIAARNATKLNAAKQKLLNEATSNPDHIMTKELDVGDCAAVEIAMKEMFEWKPIDVLVCNAGLARSGLFGECSTKDLDEVVRTNFLGCVYGVHALIPYMKKRSRENPSSIVLIGSLAGMYLLYGSNVYTATKYALRGLAEVLRLELLPYNIRVTLICPGFTDTQLLDEATSPELLKTTKEVCHYDPADIESPDDVATTTIQAIKDGEFVMVTRKIGWVLVMLTRGLFPSQSILTTLIECISFPPLRLIGFLAFWNVRSSILRNSK